MQDLFEVSGTNEKSVSLRDKSESGFRLNFTDLLNELASDASWEIHLNPDVLLDLNVDVASGSAALNLENLTLTMLVNGGSGRIRIEVPRQAAVRLVIRDGASGSVSIPRRFNLVDDRGDNDSDTGIWETTGFDVAEHQIEIVFDPGSGSFAIN